MTPLEFFEELYMYYCIESQRLGNEALSRLHFASSRRRSGLYFEDGQWLEIIQWLESIHRRHGVYTKGDSIEGT